MVGELHHFRDGFGVPLSDAAHVQLAVALLLHLGNHPLESGAPPDGEEDLGCDPVGDALQALLDKCFSLQRKGVGGESLARADKRGQDLQCVALRGPLALHCGHLHVLAMRKLCLSRRKKCPSSLRPP